MSSLFDSVKTLITPGVVQGLASSLGESAGSIEKGLQGSSVAMLMALAERAQDSSFLGAIMNLISNFTTRGMAMGAAAGASPVGGSGTASQVGSTFLNTLFGANLSSVQDKIGAFAGIRTSAAGSILSAAAPMVLQTLASRVQGDGLNASGLGSLLTSELPNFRGFLPAGFSIPGLSAITSSASQAVDDVRSAAPKWLWPVAVAVLAIVALVWFSSRNPSTVVDNAVNTASRAGDAVASGVSALGSFIKASIPGGAELNIPQNGMENRLLTYIRDPNAPVNEQPWFEFDRLTFDTGSATLQPSSQEQLGNIANILRAYPGVHARIGGYTDNQGDPDLNLKLSQDRANNVMTQLQALGVDPPRMDAVGYGAEHPVADNSTEAGRAQNRRIALRVTQK